MRASRRAACADLDNIEGIGPSVAADIGAFFAEEHNTAVLGDLLGRPVGAVEAVNVLCERWLAGSRMVSDRTGPPLRQLGREQDSGDAPRLLPALSARMFA